jgi:hypothetical protein
MAILMGVLPGIFLKPMEPSVQRAVELVVGSNAPVNTDAAGAAGSSRNAARVDTPADALAPVAPDAPTMAGGAPAPAVRAR